MASFTLNLFPKSEAVKLDSGLPLSCTIQPFAKLDGPQQQPKPSGVTPSLQEVLRCTSCYSYINHLCAVGPSNWVCSLCGKRNDIRPLWAPRYACCTSRTSKEQGSSPSTQPPPLPELQGTCYEMLVGEAGPIHASPQGNPKGPAPVFLALVDVSRGADADFIELVRSGLLAALEALPPYTLFGLITFGDKVCLHDLKAKVPCMRQVPIPAAPPKGASAGTHSHRLAVPLAEAMPLHALLAPVGAFKESITAALETIQPQQPVPQPPPQPPVQQEVDAAGRVDQDHSAVQPQVRAGGDHAALGTAHWSSIQGAGASAPTTVNHQPQQQQQQHQQQLDGDRRGFGAALFGVLEYLQAIKSPPFTLPQHSSASLPSSANGQHPKAATAARSSQGLPQEAALPDAQSPVRLAVFLSGPPDYGTASLRTSTAEAISSSKNIISGAGKGGSSSSSGGAQQSTGAQGSTQAVGSASDSGKAQGAASDAQQQQQQQQQDSQAQGPPELGNPRDAWLSQVDPLAASFYKHAAVAAAALGCCCDVYAVSSSAVGLDYLAPLPNSTGGAIFLYTSVDDSALPQDIYRRLSGQHAFGGLLRVRTSQGFHAARYYGRLFSDPQIEDLYHVINAGDSDTFAVEFLYGSSKAKPNNQEVISMPPTIQVAFQYSVAVPVPSVPSDASKAVSADGAAQSTATCTESAPQPSGDAAKASSTAGCLLQRRVRVSTFRAGVTSSPLEAMRSCNSRAVLAVMLHKLMRVSVLQGRPRARLLLLDWLVELETMYHAALHVPPAPIKSQQQRMQHLLRSPVDVSFSGAAALHPMPRLVYALLRSPVLAPPVEGQHGDLVAFLEHCWGSLTPSELACAVYPHLSAYADPDTVILSNLPLSKSMLHPPPSSGVSQIPPIFLLDAYIVILVLYTSACPSHIPYPPPQQSALRRSIGAIRQERKIAPMVRVVREGSEDAQLFFHLLLDEPAEEPACPAGQGESAALQNGGTSGNSSTSSSREQHASTMGSSADARGSGFQNFLEHVRLEVVKACMQ